MYNMMYACMYIYIYWTRPAGQQRAGPIELQRITNDYSWEGLKLYKFTYDYAREG